MSQVREVKAELDRAVERVVRQLTRNFTVNVFLANPLDTGWSRTNWVPSIGEPAEAPERPAARSIQRAIAARPRQLAALERVTSSYTLNQGNVFITNNVPYIIQLNQGASAQAPAGFVQMTIARSINELGDRIPP